MAGLVPGILMMRSDGSNGFAAVVTLSFDAGRSGTPVLSTTLCVHMQSLLMGGLRVSSRVGPCPEVQRDNNRMPGDNAARADAAIKARKSALTRLSMRLARRVDKPAEMPNVVQVHQPGFDGASTRGTGYLARRPV